MSDRSESEVRKIESMLISNELIEETYLFCYKRLGNSHDAEDVSQDILLEALKALSCNREIKSFYSWFWSMARNRINMFFRMKKYRAVKLDYFEEDIESAERVEDDLIQSETVSELNYSISRLSRLHRDVIIMYYLKEMKISEIAKELGVPEGTVKARLHDAKHTIKEEMEEMQINTGRSSYAPAELTLFGGYRIPDYWDKITDLMTKQIFVVCSKEPKTVRQIADEIGVAPVYFEEKLRYLIENRFLKEASKGKYLTDFIIYPRQVYCDVMAELSEIFDSIGRETTEILRNCENEIRDVGFYGSEMPFGTLLWILYPYASNKMFDYMRDRLNLEWQDRLPASNGKNYRVSGIVTYPDETPYYHDKANKMQYSDLHINFKTSGYRLVEHENLCDCNPFLNDRNEVITEANADLFMRIFDDPHIELTPNEEEIAANLISLDYIHKKDGGLYLAMPVMTGQQLGEVKAIVNREMSQLYVKYYEQVVDAGNKIVLPHIRKDMTEEFVHWLMPGFFSPVNWMLYYGLYSDEHPLDIPDDYSKSSKGICIYVTK